MSRRYRPAMLRVATGLLAALLVIPAASATSAGRVHGAMIRHDNDTSSNWAGYAVTGWNNDAGTATQYTNVTGSWVQPKANCQNGESYSAFWVGLGGYSETSTALEQIGTESNCTSDGRAVYDAWYEIVPAPSIPIKMKIRPGDRITTAVLVQGTQVILQITNRSTGVRVTKRVTVKHPDLSSAEWIAEAPSACWSDGSCETLPLANFGSVGFTAAAATGDGHAGTINDAAWLASPIDLVERGGGSTLTAETASGARTGLLSADGRGFSVAWHPARS